MNTVNIIIGLNDNEPNYSRTPKRPPAVHHAIVLYDVDGERYYPVCGANPHEGWTAEETQGLVNCKRCLAWLAKPTLRASQHSLFGLLVNRLVGDVRQETRQEEGWACTGCDTPTLSKNGTINPHKFDCPWPMLNEMLELGQ